MNDRLRFEVNNNQGRFVFPDTWFGPLLGEFEEVLDAYDTDEISEMSYINKLRRLAQREPDFIDIHAHLAYAFLEQNAPRKALNAALKGLAAGNRPLPVSSRINTVSSSGERFSSVMLPWRNSTLQELALTVLCEGVDKSGVRAATGSFCSSGVISTDNNSTPAPEEVVTGRRRDIRPSFCQSLSHLNRRLSLISCSRAIRATEAPGCEASLTI